LFEQVPPPADMTGELARRRGRQETNEIIDQSQAAGIDFRLRKWVESRGNRPGGPSRNLLDSAAAGQAFHEMLEPLG